MAKAVADLARRPANRFSSASFSRSAGVVIKAAPRLSWLTISKTFPRLLRRGPRREQSAYAQMGCGPFSLRDQRVGRLLKAVVDKPIGACLGFYQFLTDGRPQV